MEAINLKTASRLAATNTGSAVDLSSYTGNCKLVLNSSATEAAGQTADVKITHCDTVGGAYTDSGVAFAQVTDAAASHQVLDISVDQFKQFVKVVTTLAGATPFVTNAVELFAKKSQ